MFKIPSSKLIIASRNNNYLAKILSRNNLEFLEVSSLIKTNEILTILPYREKEIWQIDSALEIFNRIQPTILNMNDIPFDEKFIDSINSRPGDVIGLMTGYTGADLILKLIIIPIAT